MVYTINEGVKAAVSDVQFEGNKAFSDRVLRKQMKTKRKSLIAFLDKSGRLDESQFQQDLDAVREWYQDHGYIDVEIRETKLGRESAAVFDLFLGQRRIRRPAVSSRAVSGIARQTL